MTTMLRAWLFGGAVMAGLLAQEPPAPAAKPLRVHVIGASVSGGFRDGPLFGAKEQGDSVTMQHLLKGWCGEHARATTHATAQMTAMFNDPDTIGAAQIEGAKKAKPDVVVAIDFPFWFAYGACREADQAAARSARLAKGLAMLAQLEVPVLIGDLPDMTGAAPRMLSPSWIPKPEVLRALNEQLAAFVAKHPNVRLVPLGGFVKAMKVDGAVLPLDDGPLQTPPGALLQEDRLHATRLGMAFLGHLLQAHLQPLFPKDHALASQRWTLGQFVAACGAEDELDRVRAAAKAAAGAGK